MRCCKDIGIASELWDPKFILEWKEKYSVEVWCEHQSNKSKRKLFRRKDRPPFDFPWKEGIPEPKNENINIEMKEDKKEFKIQKETPQIKKPISEDKFANMFDDFDLGEPITSINENENDDSIRQINFDEKPISSSSFESSNSNSGFDINGICSFGKYKDQPWKSVLMKKGIDSYLEWLANKSNTKYMKDTGKQA
jgi:hypothetical protein